MKNRYTAFAFFVAVVTAIFGATVYELLTFSLGNGLQSHMIFVPALSAYLIHAEREKVFAQTSTGTLWGPLIVGVGLLLHLVALFVIANAAVRFHISLFGALLALSGGFLAFFGPSATKAALFPLCFLIFSFPLPDWLITQIMAFLQDWSASASQWGFRALDVPVVRSGYVFEFPTFDVVVAPECSGIRSGLVLFILSMVGGQLFLRRRWSRGAFILLSIPVTILKNSFRIVAISLLSVYVDPAFMDSYLHRSGGIFFFALALLCLVPVWWILQRLEPRDTPEADPASHGAS